MNTFDFDSALKKLGPRGGRIRLDPVRHDLTAPWVIDQPCVFLEGDVWAYSSDPNGVFESRCGTQLRLRGRSFPALSIGRNLLPGLKKRELSVAHGRGERRPAKC